MDILIQADEKPPTEGEEMVCYEPFHKLDKEPVLKKIVPGKVEELLHTFWDKKNPSTKVTGLLEAEESTR